MNDCPWCSFLERSKNRCSLNCDCNSLYWHFPLKCLNCGSGLIHRASFKPGIPYFCDSCKEFDFKAFVQTAPSFFSPCPSCQKTL